MKTIARCSIVLAAAALAGCVSYGYPGDGGGYPGPDYSGGGYPDYPGYPGGGYDGADTVRCESDDERTRHCSADTRGGVRIARRLSDAPCTQGRSWGYDDRGIWVSRGCRAEFLVGAGGGHRPGGGHGQLVRCESKDKRQRRCDAPVRRGVEIVRQLSDTRCVQGQTWGWDRGGVWVRGGCRAEFRVY